MRKRRRRNRGSRDFNWLDIPAYTSQANWPEWANRDRAGRMTADQMGWVWDELPPDAEDGGAVMGGGVDEPWARPGDPGFNHVGAVLDRREILLGLPWPGSVAVACGGAERLILAAEQVFPEELRTVAQDLVEAAWAEVLHARATPEQRTRRAEAVEELYGQAEMVRDDRVFLSIEVGCAVMTMVWSALQQPAERGAEYAMSEALEGAANWASIELKDGYGSGHRYATADPHRSGAFVRELAAWDADIATVQQRGVTAASAAQIRRRAHDVGLQHQQTIIRALTVDRLSDEEIERRRREGP